MFAAMQVVARVHQRQLILVSHPDWWHNSTLLHCAVTSLPTLRIFLFLPSHPDMKPPSLLPIPTSTSFPLSLSLFFWLMHTWIDADVESYVVVYVSYTSTLTCCCLHKLFCLHRLFTMSQKGAKYFTKQCNDTVKIRLDFKWWLYCWVCIEFWKSINMWQSYVQEYSAIFLSPVPNGLVFVPPFMYYFLIFTLCSEKKHPLMFSFMTSSQIDQFAQKCQHL